MKRRARLWTSNLPLKQVNVWMRLNSIKYWFSALLSSRLIVSVSPTYTSVIFYAKVTLGWKKKRKKAVWLLLLVINRPQLSLTLNTYTGVDWAYGLYLWCFALSNGINVNVTVNVVESCFWNAAVPSEIMWKTVQAKQNQKKKAPETTIRLQRRLWIARHPPHLLKWTFYGNLFTYLLSFFLYYWLFPRY